MPPIWWNFVLSMLKEAKGHKNYCQTIEMDVHDFHVWHRLKIKYDGLILFHYQNFLSRVEDFSMP